MAQYGGSSKAGLKKKKKKLDVFIDHSKHGKKPSMVQRQVRPKSLIQLEQNNCANVILQSCQHPILFWQRKKMYINKSA